MEKLELGLFLKFTPLQFIYKFATGLKSNHFISILKISFSALLFCAGLFFITGIANAACSHETESICDGLTVTLSPNSGKTGEQIKATLTVTSDEFRLYSKDQEAITYYLGVCDSGKTLTELFNCAQGDSPTHIAYSGLVGANEYSVDFTFTIDQKMPPSQTPHKIVGVAEYRMVNEEGAEGLIYEVNTANLLVYSNTSGAFSLSLSETKTEVENPKTPEVKVKKTFGLTFSNGGTGKELASYKYNCGDGSQDQTVNLSPALSNGGASQFTCSYPIKPGVYPVVASASIGEIYFDAKASATIKGDEEKTQSGLLARAAGAVYRGLLGFVNNLLTIILGLLMEFIYVVFFWFVAPLIQSMLSIHVYTDTFVAVIYPGWEIVRNLCNIIFILALIIIALGTLLRVESYQFRHLLVQLILAALLINFSLVIAQAVLGLADTVQAQFLPANATVIRSLAGELMVTPYREIVYNKNSWVDIQSRGSFAGTIQPLFLLALALGSFAVFCAIAVFLMIRIVALWILLMISPVAYACGVLPSTAQYRSMWWQQFLKYAFFTPIMAFFLNMAAVIATSFRENPILKNITDPALTKEFGNFGSLVFLVASNLMLLIFLIAALKVADAAGVYGAHEVTGMAQKGILAPFAGAGWLGGKGLGWVNRKRQEIGSSLLEQEGEHMPGRFKKALFAISNPDAVFKGWKARSEELKHQAESTAIAGGRELAEQVLTRGKLKIPYRQFAERKDENELAQDYSTMRKESLMAAAVDAEKLGGEEGKRRRRAIVLAAAKQGYMDDLLRKKHFANQYADKDGTFYSAEVLNRFLYGYLGDDEQAQRLMAEDLEELGKSTGHYEYLGHSYFDNDEKKFKRGMEKVGTETITRDGQAYTVDKLKNTWQVGYSVGELKKISGRLRSQIAPHNMVTLRAKKRAGSDDFDFGDEIKSQEYGRLDGRLDEYQQGVLSMFDGATLQQASFAQGRTKEWVLSEDIDKNTGEIIVKSDEDLQRITDLYTENPDLVRSLYGQLMNVRPEEVKGIKVVKLDASGKRVPGVRYDLGDPSITVTPVIKTVSTEILEDKNLGLSKDESDALKEGKVIDKAIEGIYGGNKTQAQVQADLIAAGITAPRAPSIAATIVRKVKIEYTEKYNPMTILSRVDEELGTGHKLTPADISEVRKEFQQAAGEAFERATSAGRAVDRSDFEAVVRAKLASVTARLGTDSSWHKEVASNPAKLAEVENLFINHMTPT